MSSDHVWLADFLVDSLTSVGFTDDIREKDVDHWGAFVKTAGRGLPWPADDFPKAIWAKDDWSDKRLAKERRIMRSTAPESAWMRRKRHSIVLKS